jgi:hypothetical protein
LAMPKADGNIIKSLKGQIGKIRELIDVMAPTET